RRCDAGLDRRALVCWQPGDGVGAVTTRAPAIRAARLAPALLVATGLGAIGCGGTRATVLEAIDAGAPPSANLRVDAFLIRAVSTCAVGSPCAADAAQCFSLADTTGPRASFAID